MDQVAEKLKQLRKSMAGNREITEFEYTFGKTVEEQNRITSISPWQHRIVSELEFAYRLSRVNERKYHSIIEKAIDFLKNVLEDKGTITNEDSKIAENMLLSLLQSAKEYTVILAAHAHIDMNWMWSWHETVGATLDTFRTILAIMDEYPNFCFSQSQAAVYKIVEDFDLDMMEQIKLRIAEGRWEITASTWVENDKNMPGTEALMRHNLYAKKYLSDKWAVDPKALKIDFSPDTFGHSTNMPEIMRNGEVDYCYHCRGNYDDDILYRWRAPSGAESLVYREPYWYNSAITPHVGIGIIDIAEKCAGLKTGLIIYGVGDHGGGPTRRDIERGIEMQSWPIFPTIQFGTISSYFQKAESVRDKLKIIDHELNHVFTGCYTTQSRIKLGNRKAETALYDAEGLNAIASSYIGARYPHSQFEKAWRNVLFNHFHDILTGSCVQDSREHAMGLYSESLAVANTARSNALRAIASKIDSSKYKDNNVDFSSQSEGAGAGYGVTSIGVSLPERGSGVQRIFHIVNPSTQKRKEIVELTVWDWTYDMRYLGFKDSKDESISFQLLDKEQQKYWDHHYFRVLVDVELPAFGYETVVMDQVHMEEYPFYYHPASQKNEIYENYLLENEFIRAEFDLQSGNLISLIDKKSEIEQIKPGDAAGFRMMQEEGTKSSAWTIGRYISVEKAERCAKINYNKEELRTSLEIELSIFNSTAKVTVSLDKWQSTLRFEMELDWKEYSAEGTTVPSITYAVPLNYKPESYVHDVPAGHILRSALNQDIPALQYSAALYRGRALALTSDCKYGYRNTEEEISLTLIHTPHRPDPYPERGIHHINFGIMIGEATPKAINEAAFAFSHLPVYMSDKPHKGILPLCGSLLELNEESGAVIIGIKKPEMIDGLIVHLVNTWDKETIAELTFARAMKTAEVVNSLEILQEGKVKIMQNKVTVHIKPHQLLGVKVSFDS